MRVVLSRILIALAGGMAVSGCLLETIQEEPTIDLTAVTGTGVIGDPYVLPADMPAGTNGGINDYMVASPGLWQFTYGSKQFDSGTAIGFGDLLYNSTTDTWQLTAGGNDYPYSGAGTSQACLVAACVTLTRFGTATANYGTFAFAKYDNGTDVSFAAMYYGMLSNDLQTTGTGTFNGEFVGGVYQVTKDGTDLTGGTDIAYVYEASGSVKVDADFDVNTVKMTSSGTLVESTGSVANGSYSMDNTVAISGNTYSGTISATVTLWETDVVDDGTGTGTNIAETNSVTDTTYVGTIDGGFYGPGGIETAGAVEATSTNTPTNAITGAYWAERDVSIGFGG